jgi:hypothetical protein
MSQPTNNTKLSRNLLSLKVDIEETGISSSYFEVYDIKEVYSKGIYTITIRGSDKLRRLSYIYIDLLDEKDKAVPIRVATINAFENSFLPLRRISFEINEEQANGIAKFVFYGTTNENKSVRWVKSFVINKALPSQPINQRGEWRRDEDWYEVGDVVQFEGNSFICILSHSARILTNVKIPPSAQEIVPLRDYELLPDAEEIKEFWDDYWDKYWRAFASSPYFIDLTRETIIVPIDANLKPDLTLSNSKVSILAGNRDVSKKFKLELERKSGDVIYSFNGVNNISTDPNYAFFENLSGFASIDQTIGFESAELAQIVSGGVDKQTMLIRFFGVYDVKIGDVLTINYGVGSSIDVILNGNYSGDGGIQGFEEVQVLTEPFDTFDDLPALSSITFKNGKRSSIDIISDATIYAFEGLQVNAFDSVQGISITDTQFVKGSQQLTETKKATIDFFIPLTFNENVVKGNQDIYLYGIYQFDFDNIDENSIPEEDKNLIKILKISSNSQALITVKAELLHLDEDDQPIPEEDVLEEDIVKIQRNVFVISLNDGIKGEIGLSLIFRGEWNAITEYVTTDISTDVVLITTEGQPDRYFYLEVGTVSSIGENPTNPDTPWIEFDQVFEAIATDLLLAKDVTIRRSLTMGSADEEGDGVYGSTGVIRSLGGFDSDGQPTFNQGDIVKRYYNLDHEGINAYKGIIGGINLQNDKMFIGDGTFANVDTPYYVDSVGNLSLSDKLSWNANTSTLTLKGVIRQDSSGNVISDFRNRGVWISGALYNEFDVVTHETDGKTQAYYATQNHTSTALNVPPTDPPWKIFASAGSDGTAADKGEPSRSLSILLSDTSFRFDNELTNTPILPSITVRITQNNITEILDTVNIVITDAQNVVIPTPALSGTITNGTGTKQFTLSYVDDLSSSKSKLPIKIVASLSGFVDEATIGLLQGGTNAGVQYALRADNGLFIKNSNPNQRLTLRAVEILPEGGGEQTLTSGDIKIYSNNIVGSALAITDGFDEITTTDWFIDVGRDGIDGERLFVLKKVIVDGDDVIFDTAKLIDVEDALGGGAIISPTTSFIRKANSDILVDGNDFSTDAWDKQGATIDLTAQTDPYGTNTANLVSLSRPAIGDAYFRQTFEAEENKNYIISFWIKAFGASDITKKIGIGHVESDTYELVTLQNSWQQVKVKQFSSGGGEKIFSIIILDTITPLTENVNFYIADLHLQQDDVFEPESITATAKFFPVGETVTPEQVSFNIIPNFNFLTGLDQLKYQYTPPANTPISLVFDDGDGNIIANNTFANTKDIVVTATFTDPNTRQENTAQRTFFIISNSVDGLDGIQAQLTNPSQGVQTNIEGVSPVAELPNTGTDIALYEGLRKLVFTQNNIPRAGTWKISGTEVSPIESLTVGDISKSTDIARVANHSNIDDNTDSVTITYYIVGRRFTGQLIETIATQTISKNKVGAKGETGLKGDASKLLQLNADSFVFRKSKEGVISPDFIEFTVNKQNIEGVINWTTNPVNTPLINNAEPPEVVTTGDIVRLTKENFIGANSNTVSVTATHADPVLSETASIILLREGDDSIVVSLSNETHTLPCNTDGSILPNGLLNSGTNINVYQGFDELIFDNNTATTFPTTNGRFNIEVSASDGITAGSRTGQGNPTAVVADIPSTTANFINNSTFVIAFTIKVKTKTGEQLTIVKQQTFSKSLKGDVGIAGAGLIYRGQYKLGEEYVRDDIRIDVVSVITEGSTTYFIAKQTHTSSAENLPTNDINNLFWSLLPNFQNIATSFILTENAVATKAINVGTSSSVTVGETTTIYTPITLNGAGIDNDNTLPYISIGQAGQGYNLDGIFLGITSLAENGKPNANMSLKSDNGSLLWNGDILIVDGTVIAKTGSIGGMIIDNDGLNKKSGSSDTLLQFGIYNNINKTETDIFGGYGDIFSSISSPASSTVKTLGRKITFEGNFDWPSPAELWQEITLGEQTAETNLFFSANFIKDWAITTSGGENNIYVEIILRDGQNDVNLSTILTVDFITQNPFQQIVSSEIKLTETYTDLRLRVRLYRQVANGFKQTLFPKFVIDDIEITRSKSIISITPSQILLYHSRNNFLEWKDGLINLTGTINAPSGKIGGWDISQNSIHKGNTVLLSDDINNGLLVRGSLNRNVLQVGNFANVANINNENIFLNTSPTTTPTANTTILVDVPNELIKFTLNADTSSSEVNIPLGVLSPNDTIVFSTNFLKEFIINEIDAGVQLKIEISLLSGETNLRTIEQNYALQYPFNLFNTFSYYNETLEPLLDLKIKVIFTKTAGVFTTVGSVPKEFILNNITINLNAPIVNITPNQFLLQDSQGNFFEWNRNSINLRLKEIYSNEFKLPFGANEATIRINTADGLTDNRQYELPNNSGTIALTSNIGGFVGDSNSLIAGTGETRISLHTLNGIHLGSNNFADAPFSVTPSGVLTATNATIEGAITATAGAIGGIAIANNQINSANNAFIVTSAGALTATSGKIGGWRLTTTKLSSGDANETRIELDEGLNRVSVLKADNSYAVVMGYLSGLPKFIPTWTAIRKFAINDVVLFETDYYKALTANSDKQPTQNETDWELLIDYSPNWDASNYGFWIAQGDRAVIDGDTDFVSGSWLVQEDASFLIQSGGTTVARLGTYNGTRGLFFNEGATSTTYRSTLTPSTLYVGNENSHLRWDGTNLVIKGNIRQTASGDVVLEPNFIGDWNSETLYYKGDVVKRLNVQYIWDGVNGTSGVTPPNVGWIVFLEDGIDGVNTANIFLSNENHNIPTDVDGNNPIFTNTGTEIRVFEGGSLLTRLGDTATHPASQGYNLVISVTNITAGTLNTSVPTIPSLSNITGISADTGKITFTVYIKNSYGDDITLNKEQTFIKVKRGATGETGETGVGVVYRGTWATNVEYIKNPQRADVVLNNGTYYIANQTSQKVIFDENDWALFGGTFTSVATGLLLTDNSVVKSSISIGENNTIALVGNTSYPYISIGQDPIGYGQNGIFIGQVNVGGNAIASLSLNSNTNGLSWNGTDLSIIGDITATSGNFNGTVTVGTNDTTANRISIVGATTTTETKIYTGSGTYGNDNTGFYMDASGRFSLKDKLTWDNTNLSINGAVTATSGAIGGFYLDSDNFWGGNATIGNVATTIVLKSSAIAKIALGVSANAITETANNGVYMDGTGKFRVGTATNGASYFLWDGTRISWKATNTNLDTSGNLTATSATITGTINANAGNFTGTVTIGSGEVAGILQVGTNANKITINGTNADTTTKIYSGNGNYGNVDTGFYADASGRFSLKDKLTWDGTNLSVTGAVRATSGSFSGSISASTATFGNLALGVGGSFNSIPNSTNVGAELGLVGGAGQLPNGWEYSAPVDFLSSSLTVNTANANDLTLNFTGNRTGEVGGFLQIFLMSNDNVIPTFGDVEWTLSLGAFSITQIVPDSILGSIRFILQELDANKTPLAENRIELHESATSITKITLANTRYLKVFFEINLTDILGSADEPNFNFTLTQPQLEQNPSRSAFQPTPTSAFIINSPNFKVTNTGAITAVNGSFTGEITATSGSLGALNVGGALTIGALGSLDWSGGKIDVNGINLDIPSAFSQGTAIKWGTTSYIQTSQVSLVQTMIISSNIISLLADNNSSNFLNVSSSSVSTSLPVVISSTTASTSATTGALQVAGGIGVGGNSFFGGTVTVGEANAGGHALNRTTADGRYLLQSALFDSGAGTATNNRIIDITFGGNVYRINCELLP